MNISPIAEKIIYLKVNDEQVEVDSLPKDVRFEVDTLHRFNQKKLDLLGELEMIELATLAQKSRINDILKARATPPVTERKTDESSPST